MRKRGRVFSVVVDIDENCIPAVGNIRFFRKPVLYWRSYAITPGRVSRALEAQRLMLAKIEKAAQK